jgi:YegS/Rv2252/BmrU family lipid kinase
VYAFIINAAAGRGRAAKVRPTIERFMASVDAAFRVVETDSTDEATEASSDAARSGEVVVAVGGDGSIHYVTRGLIEAAEMHGVEPTLGILPVGTGNDLARMLSLSRTVDDALQTLVNTPPRGIDYGTVTWEGPRDRGRQPFINVAGIGLDARSARLAVRLKPYIGNLCYTVSPALSVWAWKSPLANVVMDTRSAVEERWEGKLLLASVANGKWVGGGITISPRAEIDDGLLDLCLVRDVSPLRALFILPKAISGRHERLSEVEARQFVSLSLALSTPAPIHLDGEPCTDEASHARFDVGVGRLRVIAPLRLPRETM